MDKLEYYKIALFPLFYLLHQLNLKNKDKFFHKSCILEMFDIFTSILLPYFIKTCLLVFP